MNEHDADLLGLSARALMTTNSLVPFLVGSVDPPSVAEAIFTLACIELNQTLQFLKGQNQRISFRDETDIAHGDVTDHVNKMRNAVCHIPSAERKLRKSGSNVTFGRVSYGAKAHFWMPDGEVVHANPYSDDQLIFYGDNRLFVRHHIQRAMNEARAKIEQLGSENNISIRNHFMMWTDC